MKKGLPEIDLEPGQYRPSDARVTYDRFTPAVVLIASAALFALFVWMLGTTPPPPTSAGTIFVLILGTVSGSGIGFSTHWLIHPAVTKPPDPKDTWGRWLGRAIPVVIVGIVLFWIRTHQ